LPLYILKQSLAIPWEDREKTEKIPKVSSRFESKERMNK